MTGADQEWQRVSAVRSPVVLAAPHVTGLRLASGDDAPQWLSRLSVPAGWHIGRFEGLHNAPWRIAVTGHRDGSGWDGCETISVYKFEGVIPAQALHMNADVALRDLEAVDIEKTVFLSDDTSTAVRSVGHLAAGGVWIKALHNYLAAEGLLIHQSIFIDAHVDAALSADIELLCRALYTAFTARSA
ncbi:hypothetical protein [Mycolicibacterium sphagni]|uniref:Uncharacterized protein n=1 Tax=Mycolicibacterium sphagni TaxID=1786 RepID=A0ABX2K0U4_9MYCO|nr:hypothetical protein [Mycolicibacterium sphagni]NTY63623.1 hypothetical protein [Mycolicibacterium sphagni]